MAKTMIKFIHTVGQSNHSAGITADLLDKGKSVVIIVPEQQLVHTERAVADSTEHLDASELEVLSFRRLSERVFRDVGGLCYNYIGNAARVMVMSRSLDYLAQLGHVNVMDDLDTAVRYSDMVTAFKRANLSPNKLKQMAKTLRDDGKSLLAKKIEQAALVYEVFDTTLLADYDNPQDDLTRLADTLENHDFFGGKHVIIEGFTSLTAQEYSVISHIFAQSESISIVLRRIQSDERAFQRKLQHTEERMLKIAEQLGREVEHVTAPRDSERAATLTFLSEHLWSDEDVPLAPCLGDEIRLLECGSPAEEAFATAALIAESVRNGAKFRDCVIAARDLEKYRGVLENALKLHGIPYFISARSPLYSAVVVRFIFAALHIRRFGWQTDDMLALLQTDLCGMDKNPTFLLENYARMWKISGISAWQHDWSMSPSGYSINHIHDANLTEKLAELNEMRRKVAFPLAKFTEDTPNSASVKEITIALYNLLMDFSVPNQLAALAERENATSPDYAQELAQVWAVVVSCLEQLVAVAGDMNVDLKVYEQMLSLLIREADIGRIPTAINQVIVSDALLLRTSGAENVFLLGANEGEFPKKIINSGIFTHAELTQLSDIGADILPDFELSLANENFLFHSIASLPKSRLAVSWSTADMRGEALFPGVGVDAIKAIIPDLVVTNFQSLLESMGLLGINTAKTIEKRADNVKSVTERMYGDTLKLSQSRLDSFAKCPLLYTCRYVLNLAEPRPSGLSAADAGNIMHHLLEQYFREFMQGAINVDIILANAAEKLCRSITGLSMGKAKTGYARLYQLFRRQIAAAKLVIRDINEENSSFVPALIELSLSTNFSLESDKIVTLRGNIDRIDMWHADETEVFLRVVDYKSSAQNFNEQLVEQGFGLQLPLYLRLLRENSSELARRLSLPPSVKLNYAGAMYHPTNRPSIRDDGGLSETQVWEEARKKYAKNGIFLNQEDSLTAMGTSRPDDRSKGKYSAENLTKLDEKLSGVVSEISKKILDGVANSEPKSPNNNDSPCNFCAYKPICRHECDRQANEEESDE